MSPFQKACIVSSQAEAVMSVFLARHVATCYCSRDLHAGPGERGVGRRDLVCVCGRHWYQVFGVPSGGNWEQWCLRAKNGIRTNRRGLVALTIYNPGTPDEHTRYPS